MVRDILYYKSGYANFKAPIFLNKGKKKTKKQYDLIDYFNVQNDSNRSTPESFKALQRYQRKNEK